MQWSDITTPPPQKLLRQFAGLCLVVFGALAAWRAWHGVDLWVWVLAVLAVGIGVVGLIRPAAVRVIYTGWMIAAFPIGWTISRLMLALMFFVVFTPVALVFRLMRRDVLHRRRSTGASYWTPKAVATKADEYFRQF